jgi:hypothetical protein
MLIAEINTQVIGLQELIVMVDSLGCKGFLMGLIKLC